MKDQLEKQKKPIKKIKIKKKELEAQAWLTQQTQAYRKAQTRGPRAGHLLGRVDFIF